MNCVMRGFTIIEFLVYCALFAVVLMLAMQWMSSTVAGAHTLYELNSVDAVAQAASSCLVRDVMGAQANTKSWRCITDNYYVWSLGACDVGWQLSGGDLIRHQGIYDEHGTWHDHCKSLVARGVEDFAMMWNVVDEQVQSIECVVHMQGACAIIARVGIRNGVVA